MYAREILADADESFQTTTERKSVRTSSLEYNQHHVRVVHARHCQCARDSTPELVQIDDL